MTGSGQADASAVFHDQGRTYVRAEGGEPAADRRLGYAQAVGRSGDRALDRQGAEHRQSGGYVGRQ
ncbi:hypothetical protein GCM10029964_008660 [Kibdelosporangium lantanae]